MAGGMAAGRGPTLSERSAASRPPVTSKQVDRPSGARHCWVLGLPGVPDKCPGLLAEWVRRQDGWVGRVTYAVQDDADSDVVLVEAWVPAEHLQPTT